MTLAEFRAAEKMTLAALAERLGLPLTTLHGYISGKRQPDPEIIPRIVDATGGRVTAADLRPDLARLFAGDAPASERVAA
ncbi:MAG: helix-turn-helix domain-containing protein [Acetobacteraceae bacterium]|nr:helix-turn-helix domain-containing protein [Acetobacteraceae bacterium]